VIISTRRFHPGGQREGLCQAEYAAASVADRSVRCSVYRECYDCNQGGDEVGGWRGFQCFQTREGCSRHEPRGARVEINIGFWRANALLEAAASL
jgi:hypothetical protein